VCAAYRAELSRYRRQLARPGIIATQTENGDPKLQTKTTEGPFRKVFIMIAVVGQMFAKNSKQKLWLFVLYLFDPKFLKMAPGTHNVATNQINRSHCADRTRW
jgi:hypothetical protein